MLEATEDMLDLFSTQLPMHKKCLILFKMFLNSIILITNLSTNGINIDAIEIFEVNYLDLRY